MRLSRNDFIGGRRSIATKRALAGAAPKIGGRIRSVAGVLGHQSSDAQTRNVEDANIPAPAPEKPCRGRPKKVVGGEVAHHSPDAHRTDGDLAATIRDLRTLTYDLRQLVQHRVATTNRARAMCRHVVAGANEDLGYLFLAEKEVMSKDEKKKKDLLDKQAKSLFDACLNEEDHELNDRASALSVILDSLKATKAHEVKIERQMVVLAKRLPVAEWAIGVHGFSLLGLAKIIGHTGDIHRFVHRDNGVQKLWKFMELGLIDGERQRRCSNAEKAMRHNYSGLKRSLMWNIGGSLIGGMGRGPRLSPNQEIASADLHPYAALFYERLRKHAEDDPEAHRRPETTNADGVVKESFSLHAAAMAKRYVEKRLLRDLYNEWKRVVPVSIEAMPA